MSRESCASACVAKGSVSTWRLLPYDLGQSEEHFALSDALVRAAPVESLWWHSTSDPTLILGAGQQRLDAGRAVRNGIRVVHRSAGGAAVYAGPGVLGQDVFLPAGHLLDNRDVVEAYRWLGEVWQDALATLGVRGDLVSVEDARSQPEADPDVAMVCFGRLSPFEVTVAGRKLVGLAQVRRAHGTLLQAGIHLQFDADGLACVLPVADRAGLAAKLRYAAVGLSEVTPRPVGLAQIVGAVNEVVAARTGEPVVEGDWTEDELRHAKGAVSG